MTEDTATQVRTWEGIPMTVLDEWLSVPTLVAWQKLKEACPKGVEVRGLAPVTDHGKQMWAAIAYGNRGSWTGIAPTPARAMDTLRELMGENPRRAPEPLNSGTEEAAPPTP